jgi:hypothetical protein
MQQAASYELYFLLSTFVNGKEEEERELNIELGGEESKQARDGWKSINCCNYFLHSVISLQCVCVLLCSLKNCHR